MKIAIDAMGGDHAPKEIVMGAEIASKIYPDASFILYGDKQQINKYLTNKANNIFVVHTDETISNTDDPVKACRQKKNSSMVLAVTAVKNGEADACISAGNTGAYLTSALLIVGRIKGIARPALAPVLPTIDKAGVVLLDAGANVDSKVSYLLQSAIMGDIYAQKVRGIKRPRIGLLNVGTENNKGSELTKAVYPMLENANLNFVGNIEARDVLNGVADVLVTDGFTGNMILKTVEGTAKTLMNELKMVFFSNLVSKIAGFMIKSNLSALKKKLDYKEYGGAPLIGIRAPIIKAHGSSDARAVSNAIKQAINMINGNLAEEIAKKMHE